jgi:hypothetical protein
LKLDTVDCREVSGGITLKIKVVPRSSRNELVGLVGDSLKVALTSPPVDGAANAACIQFFARLCRVPKKQVTIISGDKCREKIIQIIGITKGAFLGLLNFPK